MEIACGNGQIAVNAANLLFFYARLSPKTADSTIVRLPKCVFRVRMHAEVVNVFEIDKNKFGAFVAKLRKEKGFTQKELARQLFLSDKAVSKWETGASLPDTALLIPLAELLGVSVTELLLCEKMTQHAPLQTDQVEDIVKTAIAYGEDSPKRAYQVKSKWMSFYGVSLCMGCIGTFLNARTGQPCLEALMTMLLLCAIFGAYFCCFAKTKLSAFYDENDVNFFYDGALLMHFPGMRFNNRNWLPIVKIVRMSMCLFLILFPIFNFVMGTVARNMWTAVGNYIFLAVFLCGFFLPIYLVGKKYE